MTINGHTISAFDPFFTLERILADEEGEQEFEFLSRVLEQLPQTRGDYTQGDHPLFLKQNLQQYPDRIAIVFEVDGTFKMQVFLSGQVGRLYEDILAQKEELYAFFSCDSKDILVLENVFARELPRNLDDIVSYVESIQTARQEYEKHQHIVDGFIAQYRKLAGEKTRYLNKQAPDLLARAEETVIRFLDQLLPLIEQVNQTAGLHIDRFYRPVDILQKPLLAFGLYYYGLQYGVFAHTAVPFFDEFLQEMHGFLAKHPTVAEDYYTSMHFSDVERETTRRLLEQYVLQQRPLISLANDFL